MDKWDLRFLNIAKEVSTWSKDPSTVVGAVAVGANRNILSTGYNGFPRGIKDLTCRLVDRETKYKYVVHAELNCIYNALYNEVSLKNSTMYVYGLPICAECAKGVIQAGITRVVMQYPQIKTNKWIESTYTAKQMFDETNIDYEVFNEQN